MNTLAPGYGLENRDPVTILKDIPTAALRMQKLPTSTGRQRRRSPPRDRGADGDTRRHPLT